MSNVMGLILTGGKNNRLKELSLERSISAVPFGGKYRAIDFTLSNMVNSGIVNVGLITQYNFRSLMDHLGSGKEWDLDRKNNGLFIFPPYLSEFGSGWYKGSADSMFNNITFLERSDEEFVVIAQGYAIYNMDYLPIVEQHIESGADITIGCHSLKDLNIDEQRLLGMVAMDANKRIIDFQEKPLTPNGEYCSMGIYVLRREKLIEILQDCASHGMTEFVNDVLVRNVDKLNMRAYTTDTYWRPLSTIQLYYKANMELLEPRIRMDLLMGRRKVFTKVKDEPPAKYNAEAMVKNSIIADGCIIEGTVENCVLFRGVKVNKGAIIRNSIIMQGSVIEDNSDLNHVILDKNVTITSGKRLHGDSEWPLIVGKRVRV